VGIEGAPELAQRPPSTVILPLQGRVAARGTFSNPTATPKLASTLLMIPALVLLLGGMALAADAPPGASACSGCHPAGSEVDTSVKRLKGRDAAEIVAAVQEFRSGARAATVMDRIAKGFTDDEIRAIATWYAAQKD
jgi:cytochrome c553